MVFEKRGRGGGYVDRVMEGQGIRMRFVGTVEERGCERMEMRCPFLEGSDGMVRAIRGLGEYW